MHPLLKIIGILNYIQWRRRQKWSPETTAILEHAERRWTERLQWQLSDPLLPTNMQ